MPTAPFDLNTFVFTPGDDEVIVDDTVNVDGLSPFQVLGIFNNLDVDTGKGADLIDGRLDGTNSSNTNHVIAGVYNFAEIDTGNGRDTINGEVDYEATTSSETSYYGITSGAGVAYGPIKTGKNDDIINGTARVDGHADMVVGIGNTYIDSGVGIDEITGTAHVINTVESSVSDVAGIYNSDIKTDKGDDEVIGTATVDGDASIPVFGVYGIRGGSIEFRPLPLPPSPLPTLTDEVRVLEGSEWVDEFLGSSIDAGKGNDLVEGTATVTGGSALNVAGIGGLSRVMAARTDEATNLVFNGEHGEGGGIGLMPIDMGAGNDDLIGTANATINGQNGGIAGINGIAGVDADTGNGTDLVEGRSNVLVTLENDVFGVNGIVNSYIDTGKSSDTIIGYASVEMQEGGFGSNINGLNNVMIDTGKGDDIIEGTMEVTGSPFAAGGHGIAFSDIETGKGDDVVRGTAINPFAEGGSFGIADTTIDLGKGDDEIVARGPSGGVRMVDFFGDKGDDIFDLHSGTGTIDGGKNDDLLILAGNSGDFTFTNNGGQTGNISNLSGTNLDVANIEEFQFDNGTFDFGDLF